MGLVGAWQRGLLHRTETPADGDHTTVSQVRILSLPPRQSYTPVSESRQVRAGFILQALDCKAFPTVTF